MAHDEAAGDEWERDRALSKAMMDLPLGKHMFWISYLYISAKKGTVRSADVLAFLENFFGSQWDQVRDTFDHQFPEAMQSTLWAIGLTKVNDGLSKSKEFEKIVTGLVLDFDNYSD